MSKYTLTVLSFKKRFLCMKGKAKNSEMYELGEIVSTQPKKTMKANSASERSVTSLASSQERKACD